MLRDKEQLSLLEAGEPAQAWALYWNSIYHFWAAELEVEAMAATTGVVRFEDLCERSGETVDRILAHAELDPIRFVAQRAHYSEALHAPTYYKPDLTAAEIEDIRAITRSTRERFGY